MAWTPEQKTKAEELMAQPKLSAREMLAGLLPLTPEQLAQLDENGDWIEKPANRPYSSTDPRRNNSI
jgi:hypothetical protein